tara:strand:+ start:319 stop:1236 length:918 start_codon:yes stop_codon:yes gene_type:complete
MKIKIITSYKPGTWDKYSKRGIESIAKNWPKEVDIVVYCEEPKPECTLDRITWIDMNPVVPSLTNFKNKHKNDPVACGELQEIPGGVRRLPELQIKGGLDKNKGSYLWDAVRFANKVICVIHGVRNSKDYDYVVWIDADTFTFRPMPLSFLQNLLPTDSMLTYLGREREETKNSKYPECGFVGYNLRHPEIQNFVNDWEQLYITDDVFKLLEWHDSFIFWHLNKKYKKEKNIKVNNIGKGVKGHHVFINSELGLYMDHMKGKRKQGGTSGKNDLRMIPTLEYWKQRPVVTDWKTFSHNYWKKKKI